MPLFQDVLTKRTERIHTEHDLAAVLTEHQGKRIELAIEWTDGIDSAVAGLWVKKGADVKICVRF